MAGYEVGFDGLDALMAKLDRVATLQDAKNVVKQHTARLAQEASVLVPVDTGNLKRSMLVIISSDGLASLVSFRTDYAAYVEYGTRWFVGRRFLGIPFLIEKVAFINDMERLVR